MNTVKNYQRRLFVVFIVIMAALVSLEFGGIDQQHVLASSPNSPQPNERIYRAQIMIDICNRKNAGTDDSVGVSLNARNNTWLNYSHNDFERDSQFTYDLMLERVKFVKDISHVKIHKTGSDGIAIQKFSFILNGEPVYEKNFGSSCHSLDNEDGHQREYMVSLNQLRSHTRWQSYQPPPPPPVITHKEIVSRIESIVGNALHIIDPPWPIRAAKWDHANAVKVSRKGSRSLAVHLDFEADVPGPNPSINVKFDLNLACTSGRMSIESTVPKTSVLGKDITISDRISVNMNIGSSGCPQIQINTNGDVRLTYPTPTPRPTHTPTRKPTATPVPTTSASQTDEVTFQAGRSPGTAYSGVADTTLVQNTPSQNYGLGAECYADGDDPPGSGFDMVSLLRWDISAIPSDSQVEAAWITLYVTDKSDEVYSLYGLSPEWRETQATWIQSQTGRNWTQGGATADSDRLGSVIGFIGNVNTGYRDIPLNGSGIWLVQGWVNDTIQNHGLAITNPDAINGLDFYCSQADNPARRPSLTVQYKQ